ncbi:MAG: ATP-binding protein, partial [Bacteroidota bacterium]|nr:ATP-binding protein [Bacteroidota bacterium]
KQKLLLEKTLKQLTNTQSQLIQSEKMASLGVLTAGIAHEINNPINYINSGLEGLNTVSNQIIETISNLQQPEDEITDIEKQNKQDELTFLSTGIQTLTTNIQTGVNRTTEIIKSLKTFSHADNNTLSLSNINEDLDSSLLLLHNQLKNKIKIIRNYEKIPEIYCYSSKLNQVFMNIISNAIQAIKEKGTITITTTLLENYFELEQNCIKISILDTGTGIPEKIQNKIFEPFFTTKEVGQGTGLGLSITHSIIKQHNGKIEVSSSANAGTKFEIYLPITKHKNAE